MPTPTPTWPSLAFISICAFLGSSLAWKTLSQFRTTTIIKEPRPKTQYITQATEDSLTSSTLKKLISSTTYSIREIAARIVCDRALHDDYTIESLLWYITRPDHEVREKGLRALYLLCTKSGMSRLDKPRVYSAIVKSLTFCVTDTPHLPYDKDFDTWDFRDINERLCLMLIHRLTIEFGISNFIQYGIVSRWLVKEPWGTTEQEIQENVEHCYHQTYNLLSYIVLRILGDTKGIKELRKAKLVGSNSSSSAFTLGGGGGDVRMVNGESTAGEGFLLADFAAEEILPSIEGGGAHPARGQERSPEEQRMRRNHRDAMVLHDSSEPLGLDSIITRDAAVPTRNIADVADEVSLELDRSIRAQELLDGLNPRRLENMREVLRNETRRMEQAGEGHPVHAELMRDMLNGVVNQRLLDAGLDESLVRGLLLENAREDDT